MVLPIYGCDVGLFCIDKLPNRLDVSDLVVIPVAVVVAHLNGIGCCVSLFGKSNWLLMIARIGQWQH